MISVTELNWKIKARGPDIRIGQALFNALLDAGVEGVEDCRGSTWDPFYVVDDMPDYASWMNRHAVIVKDMVTSVRVSRSAAGSGD